MKSNENTKFHVNFSKLNANYIYQKPRVHYGIGYLSSALIIYILLCDFNTKSSQAFGHQSSSTAYVWLGYRVCVGYIFDGVCCRDDPTSREQEQSIMMWKETYTELSKLIQGAVSRKSESKQISQELQDKLNSHNISGKRVLHIYHNLHFKIPSLKTIHIFWQV